MLLNRRQLFAAIGLTAIAPAVAHAQSQAELTVGGWERYYLGLDGGAHQRALQTLGISYRDGVRADDPFRLVTTADLRRAVELGDHAAADYLREHLALNTPSMLGQGLEVLTGEGGLEERYLIDPNLQLKAIGLYPRHRHRSFALPESVRKRIRASA